MYLVAAGLWIFFSDDLAESLASDQRSYSILQTYKGWFFVAITSVVLYLLIKKHHLQLQKKEAMLRGSESLHKRTFESLEESVIIVDTQTRTILDCNLSTEKMFGYSRDELIGKNTRKLHVDKDHYRKFERIGKNTLKEEGTFRTEYKLKKKNGELFYSDHTVSLVYNSEGNADRAVSIIRDITRQIETRKALEDSEEKYRHIFENNPVPMWIYNPDTLEFVEVNRAAVQHYGYSEEEFLSMAIADIRPTDDIKALKKDVQEHRNTSSYGEEWVHLKKDGSRIDVKISAANIEYDDSTYRLVLANDITDQKRVHERILQSAIETENRERKRFAQELHDGIGQYLASAKMNLESVKSHIDPLPKNKQKQLKTSIDLLKHAISESRVIAHNLMPSVIEDYGLVLALETLLENVLETSDINYSFNHRIDYQKLSLNVQLNIYRIVQEAIRNALKYSQCSQVSVQLYEYEDQLSLTIEDDGIGLKLDKTMEEKGIGLKSIRSRTKAISGQIEIDSKPGKGVTITLDIPILPNLSEQGYG